MTTHFQPGKETHREYTAPNFPCLLTGLACQPLGFAAVIGCSAVQLSCGARISCSYRLRRSRRVPLRPNARRRSCVLLIRKLHARVAVLQRQHAYSAVAAIVKAATRNRFRKPPNLQRYDFLSKAFVLPPVSLQRRCLQ